ALVEREKFFALGGFDERFRNGCEDVDLCLRARRRGWPSFVATASTVEHHVSATPGRKEHEDANIALFFERWQPLAAPWGRDWETRLLLQRSPHARPAPHGAWGDARPAGPTRLLVDASLPPAEADPHATAERLREFLIALRAAG